MSGITPKDKIRNIAIIAHVDHGKTTLIDAFIKQAHIYRDNQEEMQQEQILDSNDQERERGITISAKNIALEYKGHRINIIDTPGHADFGGEVERTLNMADGCVLVVDAQEGVMPQTKFVLKKAFELGLKPIVLVNKIDKRLANAPAAISKVQDLFLNLATDDSQLDFKVFYSIARDGKVFAELPVERDDDLKDVPGDTTPLLDEVIANVPAPKGDENGDFQMQVSSLDFDPHYGRYLVGKIVRGVVNVNDSVIAVNADDPTKKMRGKVKMISLKNGLVYEQSPSASVGEIVALAGLDDVGIGDTVCISSNPEALPTIQISPPSLKIKFEANTSPFLGREGDYANLKQLQSRLDHEQQVNVSLKIEKEADGSYYVSGRGELHLAVLIESLRREGYEFQVRKPEVIVTVVDGVKMEPQEEVYIEVPEEYFSAVSQEINQRKGELVTIEQSGGTTRMTYLLRTQNLIGLKRILLTATKGNLVISNSFDSLVKLQPPSLNDPNGRLVSTATGKALAYALNMIQERGRLLIEPATEVYEGMVIGLNKYEGDIAVNPMKAREKSNVRMSSAQVTDIALKSPLQLTLEYAIEMIREDEILEVTPLNLRVRKKFLNKQQEFEANKRRRKEKDDEA